MRRTDRALRVAALGALLLGPATLPALLGGSGSSCAAAAGRPHAALVVDTGGDATTYCVALDAATVSGVHLIQLAGSQFRLSYRLGFGGQAVCMLNGVGASGNDCFGSYPYYWGYWHGDGVGHWTWAGSGAGSARVGDGGMDGWVWGSGDSSTTHAAPPALALTDVCTVGPSPTPSTSPSPTPAPGSGGGAGGSGGSGGAGSGGGGDLGSGSEPPAAPASSGIASPSPRENVATSHQAHTSAGPPAVAKTTVVGGETVRAAAPLAGGPGGTGGPPLGGVVAAAAVGLLAVGGWLRVRRRPGRSP
jgi:hypothetical protein